MKTIVIFFVKAELSILTKQIEKNICHIYKIGLNFLLLKVHVNDKKFHSVYKYVAKLFTIEETQRLTNI